MIYIFVGGNKRRPLFRGRSVILYTRLQLTNSGGGNNTHTVTTTFLSLNHNCVYVQS